MIMLAFIETICIVVFYINHQVFFMMLNGHGHDILGVLEISNVELYLKLTVRRILSTAALLKRLHELTVGVLSQSEFS